MKWNFILKLAEKIAKLRKEIRDTIEVKLYEEYEQKVLDCKDYVVSMADTYMEQCFQQVLDDLKKKGPENFTQEELHDRILELRMGVRQAIAGKIKE